MDNALQQTREPQSGANQSKTEQKLDWRRKISNHVAYALLAYTGLHIFGTMTQLKGGSGSMLPYLALIILVAAIIPACRWFEMRWDGLSDSEAADPSRAGDFKRDVMILWASAIGLPVLLTLGFKGISAIF